MRAVLMLVMGLSTGAHAADLMDKQGPMQGVEPVAGVATVVFMRPSGAAFAIKPAILDQSGRFLGESRVKSSFVTQMPPGEYSFTSWGEGTPTMQAELEAGEVYYVKVDIGSGAWTARCRLFGIGPSHPDWVKVGKWLGKTKELKTNATAGAAYITLREADAATVLQKGAKVWRDYDREDRNRRTLTPDDGVTESVRPR